MILLVGADDGVGFFFSVTDLIDRPVRQPFVFGDAHAGARAQNIEDGHMLNSW